MSHFAFPQFPTFPLFLIFPLTCSINHPLYAQNSLLIFIHSFLVLHFLLTFLLPSSSPPLPPLLPFLLSSPTSSPPLPPLLPFLLSSPTSSPPLPSYIRCFYWAVLTVSGIRDLEERNPTTTVEYTVEMLGYLIGIFIIAVFIGEVST